MFVCLSTAPLLHLGTLSTCLQHFPCPDPPHRHQLLSPFVLGRTLFDVFVLIYLLPFIIPVDVTCCKVLDILSRNLIRPSSGSRRESQPTGSASVTRSWMMTILELLGYLKILDVMD